MPVSITYWRDVLRKLTTTEMDNNFENLANAIENAGLSPTMPEGQIYIGDNTNTASLETLDTSIVPETTDKNYQTDNQKLFNDATSSIQTQFDNINNLTPAYNLSVPTGVCEGGILSINADPTKFNISNGFGYIADLYTDPDPANATITKVTWSGLTAQTVTNLGSSTVSFIYINSVGSIVQTTTQPTEETLRDYIYLGQLGHSNFTSIQTAIPQPSVAQSPMSQLRDLWLKLKYINDGNLISANGANLSLNKSNGYLTGSGVNADTNIKSPSSKNFPAQTLATIRRRTQTGGTGTSTTLDVLNYDLGGTVTTITGTKAQNQRVFILPSGNLIVQYGQTLYNSLTEAVQGIETETFIELENVKTGQLIAIISVTSNCTSLQDTSRARIKNVGKFGEVNVGAGASSVSTLQQAYTNSTTPEILTDTTRGALSVKRGTASDTDTVFDVQNGAGTETFTVDGNGLIKSAQATASTPAFFSNVKGIISATGALLGTWFQTLTADTNPVDADTIVVNDSTTSFEAKKTTLLQLWSNYLLGKVQALGYLVGSSLTSNYLPFWNGSQLVNSTVRKISGGDPNVRFDDRIIVYGQNANPTLYVAPFATGGSGIQIESSNTGRMLDMISSTTSDSTPIYLVKQGAGGYYAWLQSTTPSGQSPNKANYDSTLLLYRNNASATTPNTEFGNGLYNIVTSSAGSLTREGLFRFKYYNIGSNKAGYLFSFSEGNHASANSVNITPDGVVIGGNGAPNASAQLHLQSVTKGIGLNLVPNASKPTGLKGNFLMNDTNSVLEFTTGTGANWQELAVYKFDELLQITDCNALFATANTGVYFPFVPKCDMNVTKIYYNLQSTGTDTVRVAIYSDSSNQATTLLVQGSESTTGATTTGQRSITIASTRLLSGTRYWIAIKNDSGVASFLSKNNVYSNNITREGFTSGDFVTTPAPSSSTNAVWLGIGI